MDQSIEEKWQKRWAESHIFEPETDSGKKKFMITVPWPYTNGPLHVGHGRTYTLADIIARYKRMTGYNVLFPMAFHQSGTPILAFSERIRLNDEKTIGQYRDNLSEYEDPDNIEAIIESFRKPENIAAYFSERIVKDFTSLGYSMDWTRRFTSADPFYQNFVVWQFEKLHEKGLIKSGRYPVLYSTDDQNAVGEDDISDGDIDKVTIEEYTAVIFRGTDYSLVAASLRPETIFGITNLWISPEGDYVLVEIDGEKFAVSRQAAEKLMLQRDGVTVIGNIRNSQILSQEFSAPLSGRKLRVYQAEFVDPDNGTGVVYSVPGHAVWDFVAMKEYAIGVDPVSIIEVPPDPGVTVQSLVSQAGIAGISDSELIREATQKLYREEFYSGTMNDRNGKYSGMTVQQARESIRNDLFSQKLGFIFYETSRHAATRAGSKVVVAVMKDQWFIDYSVPWWKKQSHDLVGRMSFFPEFYRNAMNDAIDWLRERPCARRRGIGTRLPFNREWVIESLSDSTIYPAVYTNSVQLREIFRLLGRIPEELMDFIYGSGDMSILAGFDRKIQDLATEARNNLEYWYGVDIRLTAHPHLSNHLSFYVMNHAALFPEKLQPRGLIISGLVISNGAKISKSKGNAISLLRISHRYSADLYRLFVAVNADIASTLDWNEEEIQAVRKKYETFLSMVSNHEHDPGFISTQIESWFESRFNQHLEDYFQGMEKFDLRGAIISIFYEVMNDIRYVEQRGGNTGYAISRILDRWILALAPVIPHTCEELWESMGREGFVSTTIMDRDQSGPVDSEILSAEKYLQKLIQDVRDIIRATSIDPATIDISVCGSEMRKLALLLAENRVTEATPRLKPFIGDYMKNRKNIDTSISGEAAILRENLPYLEKTFQCQINISENSPVPGKKIAWPGRPVITLKPSQ
ncbi:MAG: leucine--tRNA ligase [Thermoplasmataceae archaeon]